MSTSNPPSVLGGFEVHRRLLQSCAFRRRLARAMQRAGAASGQGEKPTWNTVPGADATRPLTARRSDSPSMSGRRQRVGAGGREVAAAAIEPPQIAPPLLDEDGGA